MNQGIDDNDSAPEDPNYIPLRNRNSKQGSHIKRHFDPALKNNTEWDGNLSRFVRRSTRAKKVTQLFAKSENCEGNKFEVNKAKGSQGCKHHIKHKKGTKIVRECVKREFNGGDIVSVNGKHLKIPELKNVTNPPIFYGTVEEPLRYNPEMTQNLKDHQSLVHVVLSGNCKWTDNNTMNWKFCVIEDEYLTLEVPSPTSKLYSPHHDLKDCVKWFLKNAWGWVPKAQHGCENCGSPWCEFQQFKKGIETSITNAAKQTTKNNKMKRATVYREVYFLTNGDPNSRMRLGWCIENAVRKAFPDENYVGFVDAKVASENKK